MPIDPTPKDLFEILAYAATILGIPLAIALFLNEKRKERRERESGTCDASNEKYVQDLSLCLEKPDLNLFDVPLGRDRSETTEEERKTRIMFTILIAMMERAFLLYRGQGSATKAAHRTGRVESMQMRAFRPRVRRARAILVPQSDRGFVACFERLLESTPGRGLSPGTQGASS